MILPEVGFINDLHKFNREFTAENSDNAAYRSLYRLTSRHHQEFRLEF